MKLSFARNKKVESVCSGLMSKFSYIISIILICGFAFGQNPDRKFIDVKQNGNDLIVTVSDGYYQISPYNNNIIETAFIPKGEKHDPESHAVSIQPEKVKSKLKNSKNNVDFSTDGLSVSITKSPFQISYSYRNNYLVSEKYGYIKTDNTEQIQFNLNSDEIIYGSGERVLGMNRRGYRLPLYNRAHYGYEKYSEQMNFAIPMILSSQIYAIHFDNAPIGFLDIDSQKDNTLKYETISGRKVYQVIAGNNWYELMDNYTCLTGKQPMLPRWALGNFASRFGYKSQEQTEKAVQKFVENEIPLDAIILDLYWFGRDVQGTMGNLEFEKSTFPEPLKMIENNTSKGVKTILITEPFILTTSKRWNEAVSKDILAKGKDGKPFTYDFYFGHTGLIDIFNPKGIQWFWNIYKELAKMGVTGVWGDLGEPEVHPSELIHHTGTADELHNIYGHNWAKLVYEGYEKDFPEQRPFILMRAGYSGSQKYGMVPWSGDVSRSWGGLYGQAEISLQMGMQGLAYMHSDLGGFAGDYYDDKLYLRWLQYGVFQPIFRPHAQDDVAPEPVYREKNTMRKAKEIIELRYKLLPYNYTLMYENNQTGMPLMRPLFFEEKDNPELLEMADSYLWGNDFLVKTIVEEYLNETEVYFPKSNNWFDFYSGKKYKTGTKATIEVTDEHLPVFVRSGAFIPMIDVIQNTEEYSIEKFDLHFYFDSETTESKGQLYHDDGKTPNAYEKGKYELIRFKHQSSKEKIKIDINNEVGKDFKSTKKNINLIIHNIEKAPSEVKINEKNEFFIYDREKKTCTVIVNHDGRTEVEIR